MSNSFKKLPIFGISTATSEKQEKRDNNRKLRRKTKQKLKCLTEFDTLPEMKEISNPWKMGKDGKLYRDNASEKDMRK